MTRSPTAHHLDPPVEKLTWKCTSPVRNPHWYDTLRRALGCSATDFARVVWHGGLYAGGRRLGEDPNTWDIKPGETVTAYRFKAPVGVTRLSPEDVVFRRAGVVGVAKPAWLPVQGSRASQRISLEAQLRELIGASWLTPVHRLDRQTSGINLFATSPTAAGWMCNEFRRRRVSKEYLAWVYPEPREERWTVLGYLAQVPHPHHACYTLQSRRRSTSDRESYSRFEVISRCDRRALVRATPLTGRTHQLRVHLAASGSPVVGDTLYGPPFLAGAPSSAERMLLHAASLRVRLPRESKLTRVRVPAPADFYGNELEQLSKLPMENCTAALSATSPSSSNPSMR